MNITAKSFIILISLTVSLILTGCIASPRHPKYEDDDESDTVSVSEYENESEENGNLIIKTALIERKNEMYSPDADTTYLYWLRNKPVLLRKTTKCNIFALNTLYKAGFKTPKTNALSRDLYNESLFEDIIPVVRLKSLEDIRKGDLVVWKYHVIIFESLVYIKDDPYAKAIWAGTSKRDDGKKVMNNVMRGNYPLKGSYIVRRPERR
ncbi:MAG TPA: hypothetical protein VN514_06805 [Ignavibacteria bacterium]|nr:hypothetical protein [Ignavibacteria bacterium]